MPSVAHYRRVWFALLKESGIAEEDRHAVQEALTGKPSTRDWTPRDWQTAIAEQQRTIGQHNDRHAHVREDRPKGVASEPGTWCTSVQAAYIADLVARTEWTVSPLAYLSRNVLTGPEKALRRLKLKQRFAEVGNHGPDLWLALTRDEAAQAVRAFRKAAATYPRESAPSIASRDGGPEQEPAHA